jgi:sterol desaturase/sphingolipid hydroxylase (fatty acid hydroxylase superfamily)
MNINISYIIILSFLLFLLIIENKFPKRKFSTSIKLNSYLTNTYIILFNNIIFYLLQFGALYYFSQNLFSLNLLSNLDYSNTLILISILIFLDLIIYYWHKLNHTFPFLWIFHKTHHTEIYLNSLSGLRFHIGELVLSVIFKSILLIMILGIPIKLILISESIVILFSIFHHSNINLIKENFISNILITPKLHQVHHSIIQKEYDSNYGVVLSIWDRLFKTYNNKEIKQIGLGKIKFQNFIDFLKFGFKYNNKHK